nr:MAG TPA: hypothetical protein [Caudoviricetes sp.]
MGGRFPPTISHVSIGATNFIMWPSLSSGHPAGYSKSGRCPRSSALAGSRCRKSGMQESALPVCSTSAPGMCTASWPLTAAPLHRPQCPAWCCRSAEPLDRGHARCTQQEVSFVLVLLSLGNAVHLDTPVGVAVVVADVDGLVFVVLAQDVNQLPHRHGAVALAGRIPIPAAVNVNIRHSSSLLPNIQQFHAAINTVLGDFPRSLASGRNGHSRNLAGGLVTTALELGVVAEIGCDVRLHVHSSDLLDFNRLDATADVLPTTDALTGIAQARCLVLENEHLGLGELCRGVECCIEHLCPLVIDHDGHAGFALLAIHPAIVGKSDILHDVVLSI